MSRGKILTTIPHWFPSWKIKFTIKRYAKISSGYENIFYFVGAPHPTFGNRMPAIFFNTNYFHTGTGINGNWNQKINIAESKIPLHIATEIEFSQIHIGNNDYEFKIMINGVKEVSMINSDARYFPNVHVYASHKSHNPVKANISELMIYSYL